MSHQAFLAGDVLPYRIRTFRGGTLRGRFGILSRHSISVSAGRRGRLRGSKGKRRVDRKRPNDGLCGLPPLPLKSFAYFPQLRPGDVGLLLFDQDRLIYRL